MQSKLFVLFLVFVLLVKQGAAQDFIIYKGDTLNRYDLEKKRDGEWVVFDKQKSEPEARGLYKANKREGPWRFYFADGRVKAEVTYKKGRQRGIARTYHPNGKLAEEGNWQSNKWIGEYKVYHPNGAVAYDWLYNQSGKLTGVQKYYYPNGQLMMQGKWNNGLIEGKLKEYYADGSWRAERTFKNGKINHRKTKTFEPSQRINQETDSIIAHKMPQVSTVQAPQLSLSYFSGEGFHRLFKDSLLNREGEFKNGKLWDGKKFIYRKNRTLLKTIIYKGGKASQVILANP